MAGNQCFSPVAPSADTWVWRRAEGEGARSDTVCLCSSFQRERQAQREDAQELTEKLDRDWREIQSLLARRAPQAQSRHQEEPQVGTGPSRRRGRGGTGVLVSFLVKVIRLSDTSRQGEQTAAAPVGASASMVQGAAWQLFAPGREASNEPFSLLA